MHVVTGKCFSEVRLDLAPKGSGGVNKPNTKGRVCGRSGKGQKNEDAKVRNYTACVGNLRHSVLLESGVQLEQRKGMKLERQVGVRSCGAQWAGLMIWILPSVQGGALDGFGEGRKGAAFFVREIARLRCREWIRGRQIGAVRPVSRLL